MLRCYAPETLFPSKSGACSFASSNFFPLIVRTSNQNYIHRLPYSKFNLNIREIFLTVRVVEYSGQAAPRACGISVVGDIQNITDMALRKML